MGSRTSLFCRGSIAIVGSWSEIPRGCSLRPVFFGCYGVSFRSWYHVFDLHTDKAQVAPLLTIGLFGFAWTSLGPPKVHWIAPMIFSTLIAIANVSGVKLLT